MNSVPEPDRPRTTPDVHRTDDTSPVRPPYPSAPDLTPPGPWPGLIYLGAGGAAAGRPAIPATVVIAPDTDTDTGGNDRRHGHTGTGPGATWAAIVASFATPGARIGFLSWPTRPGSARQHPQGAAAPALAPAAASATAAIAHVDTDTDTDVDNDAATSAAPAAIATAAIRPLLLGLTAATTSPTDRMNVEQARGTATAGASPARLTGLPSDMARSDTVPSPAAPPLDLIITSVAPGDVDEARLSAVAVAAAHALRCGGLLLVLTHSDHDKAGRLVDPGGLIVSAAQNADLLYFQHIVIIDAPVHDGRVQLPHTPTTTKPTTTKPTTTKPTTTEPTTTDPLGDSYPAGAGPRSPEPGDRSGRPGAHRRAHQDLFVFGQQHDHHAAAESADDPVIAPTADPAVEPAARLVVAAAVLVAAVDAADPSDHPTEAGLIDSTPTRGILL